MSAFALPADYEKSIRAGMNDHISKPFNPDLLKARVRNQPELKGYRDKLEQMVSERTRQLKEAFESLKTAFSDSIHRLMRAAECKDEDTGAHTLRMSHYCAAIARKLGLNENVVESILYAAPMHDVGKIGIPDRILLRPGRLDADEEIGDTIEDAGDEVEDATN